MPPEKKLNVLVVEDDRDMAFTISKLLMKQFAVEVDTALDIAAARKRLGGKRYDVVTIDYQLPDGNGIQLLEEVVGADHDISAIVVTGHGDEAVEAKAMEAGAVAYIIKDTRMSQRLSEAFQRTLIAHE